MLRGCSRWGEGVLQVLAWTTYLRSEQPGHDHGISNIGDLKLIKAQQPRLLQKVVADVWDGVILDTCLPKLVHSEGARGIIVR